MDPEARGGCDAIYPRKLIALELRHSPTCYCHNHLWLGRMEAQRLKWQNIDIRNHMLTIRKRVLVILHVQHAVVSVPMTLLNAKDQ